MTAEAATVAEEEYLQILYWLQEVGLRPELVIEIDFDHVSAGRIRHGAKLRRWREDKPPDECTFDQLAG